MSGLIERLRRVIIVDGLEMPGNDALHAEAADEIERLQARVEELEGALIDWSERIKASGKRKCATCYSIYCDIGIHLADTEQEGEG